MENNSCMNESLEYNITIMCSPRVYKYIGHITAMLDNSSLHEHTIIQYLMSIFCFLQLQELRKLITSYDKQVNLMKTEIDHKVVKYYIV